MDDQKQLDRIESKLEKIDTRLNKVDVTLVAQHITLLDHTERSTKLENIVMPIKSKIDMAEGALKLLGLVAMVSGIIDAILRLLHH